jgi:predicted acetyltransferase
VAATENSLSAGCSRHYGDGVDYTFATLDLNDESDGAAERRGAWLGAVMRGFHEGRPDEEFLRRWTELSRADRAGCRGAWLPEGEIGAGPMPVATYTSFDKTLNAGLELLPLRMITDVTVSPAHRRRGLLRRLIEEDLADAAAAGVPVAALTASEATIYGRWGFGPATFHQSIELDTGPRFSLRSFADEGRVELLEPLEAWPHVRAVFERFHGTQRGSVEWPAFYETIHTGAFDFDEGGPDKKLRAVLHIDGGGAVDGFLLYRHDGREGEKRKVKVTETIALTSTARLALWDFVGGIDLVNHVSFSLAHPDDPLRWALTDINALKNTGLHEFLWIRVLDVERSLAARPWTADGRVVVEVDDQQGHAAGRFRVETSHGRATVTRTDAPAEVFLTAETLGSLYLGGPLVSTLHRAGRLHGADGAVSRFGAMADLADAPYNVTGF